MPRSIRSIRISTWSAKWMRILRIRNHHRRLLERPRDGELDKGPRHQAETGRGGHDERRQKDAALGELTELAEALAGSRLGR
jgi:hypothetical protein